jgi:hypothetical protein
MFMEEPSAMMYVDLPKEAIQTLMDPPENNVT